MPGGLEHPIADPPALPAPLRRADDADPAITPGRLCCLLPSPVISVGGDDHFIIESLPVEVSLDGGKGSVNRADFIIRGDNNAEIRERHDM